MGQVELFRSSAFPTPSTQKNSLCQVLSEMEFALFSVLKMKKGNGFNWYHNNNKAQ